ncbi:diacylglycerol kinase beta-like [Crassostrea virginica]
MADVDWKKISPEEFHQLQEYTSYSAKKLKDVLEEFNGDGCLSKYNPEEPIGYDCFVLFMETYLDAELPEELCKHLFYSFMKKPSQVVPAPQNVGKDLHLKDVAAVTASQTVCAPITHLGTEILVEKDRHHSGLAEKLHGLTEKLSLHGLGHSRHDSGSGELGRRSRAECMSMSIDVPSNENGSASVSTHTSVAMTTNPSMEKTLMARDDSQLDASTHSRSSSKKSNHSIHSTHNGHSLDSIDPWIPQSNSSLPRGNTVELKSVQKRSGSSDIRTGHIYLKDLVCFLSLLEAGRPEDKLECEFTLNHHWVEGNCPGRCDKCKKSIKTYNGLTGVHCRWCHISLHNKCTSQVKPECDLGEFREHTLPPTSICPAVLGPRSGKNEKKGLQRTDSATFDCSKLSQGLYFGQSSFQITPVPGSHPLLVFVNPKSGGKQGAKLIRKFQYLLNPRQVYDMIKHGPTQGLQFFKDVPGARILVCGGDGTVGWLIDAMDKLGLVERPPVAVLPLGTGNDLARCLRWGGGYDGENPTKILQKVSQSARVMMDRWKIEFSKPEEGDEEEEGDPIPCNIINNYFSIGVDASIAHRFHLMREKHPEKFNSRMKNKMWYFEFYTSETLSATCKNLHEEIDIMCDGYALDLANGPRLEGIALLNIPSIYGGTNLWGDNPSQKKRRKAQKAAKKDKDREFSTSSMSSAELSIAVQDVGDSMIEVVGLENSMHMGQVYAGLRASGRRLAQCTQVVIRTRKRFPMQIDGEPWLQPPCTINITHKNQVPMLMGPPSTKKSSIFKIFKK